MLKVISFLAFVTSRVYVISPVNLFIPIRRNLNCSPFWKENKEQESIPAGCISLLGNHTCFSFSGRHQMSLLGDSQMRKFEQVSSNHHLMSLAKEWGCSGLMSGVPYLTLPKGYLVMWPVSWCISCYPPPVNRQTPVKTLPSRKRICGR